MPHKLENAFRAAVVKGVPASRLCQGVKPARACGKPPRQPFWEFERCVKDTPAVGNYLSSTDAELTLAEHWNGQHWTIQRTPNVTGGKDQSMYAVRCPSARECIAVGYYFGSGGVDKTLAEHWNGHHWTIQSTPNAPS